MYFPISVLQKLCYLSFFGIILRFCVTSIGVTSFEITCLDPQQRRGVCRPFDKCTHLSNKLNGMKVLTPKMEKFLNNSMKACEKHNNATGLETFCCRSPPPFPCGESSSSINRISNGKDAKLLEFRWMARLIRDDNLTQSAPCGGSLIDLTHVLTAAHCCISKHKPTHVVLGEHDTAMEKDCNEKKICAPSPQKIPIKKIITHEDFQSQHLNNDIAIIRLKHPVNISAGNIHPVCLPKNDVQNPNNLTITGWGGMNNASAARILQKGYVNVIHETNCSNIPNSFCTRSESVSCRGDSGGPVFGTVRLGKVERSFQFGIIREGGKKCGPEFIGAFLNVTQYIDWIQSKRKL